MIIKTIFSTSIKLQFKKKESEKQTILIHESPKQFLRHETTTHIQKEKKKQNPNPGQRTNVRGSDSRTRPRACRVNSNAPRRALVRRPYPPCPETAGDRQEATGDGQTVPGGGAPMAEPQSSLLLKKQLAGASRAWSARPLPF